MRKCADSDLRLGVFRLGVVGGPGAFARGAFASSRYMGRLLI